jgi:hypothetical protein
MLFALDAVRVEKKRPRRENLLPARDVALIRAMLSTAAFFLKASRFQMSIWRQHCLWCEIALRA